MAKDPAFLLYSKDFYEGTRLMLPEERACYIDLLIYQHQHGIIPLKLNRVLMYCTGVKIETLEEVLNEKFNQTVDGWLNLRLAQETEQRSKSKPKKIASATLAGLVSSNKQLTKEQVIYIKKSFKIGDYTSLSNDKEIKESIKIWFYNLVNQMVNNLVNVNENVILDYTYSILELKEKYKKENKIHKIVCDREKISKDFLFEKLDEFTDKLITEGRRSDYWRDYTRYFNNWLPKNKSSKKVTPIDPTKRDKNLVYFHWEHEGVYNTQTIEKHKSEAYFNNQKKGGYIAKVI